MVDRRSPFATKVADSSRLLLVKPATRLTEADALEAVGLRE